MTCLASFWAIFVIAGPFHGPLVVTVVEGGREEKVVGGGSAGIVVVIPVIPVNNR